MRDAADSGKGRLWLITGPDKMAYNEPGKPAQVEIVERALDGVSNKLEVPPLSVCLYALAME